MAAIINHINQNQHRHILTLENPIEFLHRDINCSVTQRESASIRTISARACSRLRQDPDVILIGELRDAETVDTAMRPPRRAICRLDAAHAGRVTTVSRIVSMFPTENRRSRDCAVGSAARGHLAAAAAARRRARARAALEGDDLHRHRAGHSQRGGATSELPTTSETRARSNGMQTFDQSSV